MAIVYLRIFPLRFSIYCDTNVLAKFPNTTTQIHLYLCNFGFVFLRTEQEV
jgi:hypothetical protein